MVRAAKVFGVLAALAMASSLAMSHIAHAQTTYTRQDNTTTLDLAGAWSAGGPPTSIDTALWDSTVPGASNVAIGDNMNWAQIQIANPGGLITIGATANRSLTLNGIGGAGNNAIDMSAATQNLTISAALVLSDSVAATQTWNIGSGRTLTVGGVTSGSGGIVKVGAGTLLFNANNTYTGNTSINAGTLQIGNAASLGGGTYAGSIFIGAGATLRVSRQGAQTLSGVISGDGGLIKEGGGTLFLGNSNTYTGQTTILPSHNTTTNFVSVMSFNSVVGGTASSSLGVPTTVANGTIVMGASGTGRPAGIEYTGSGETTDRVINFQFNNNGSVHTITTTTAGSLLTFTSAPTSNRSITANGSGRIVLSGDGDGEFTQGIPVGVSLTKSGSGTWTLGGPVGNGPLLTVEAGTLALQKKSSLQNGDTANWTAAKINVKGNATLALNVDSGDVDGLSATSLDTLLTNIYGGTSTSQGLQAGAILGLDTSTATGGTFTQGNAITDSTGTGGGLLAVTKLGTGTLVLDKANTYTGDTTVTGGTLLVNGTHTGGGTYTVASGATLGGNGTIGSAINAFGTIAPGNSIDTLTTGTVTWNGAASADTATDWVFELDSVGDTADLLNIAGDFLMNTGFGSVFRFDFADSAVSPGDTFDLVTWSGSIDFVATDFTYTNLGGGNSGNFQINVNTLQFVVVPEPATLAIVATGLGALGILRNRRRKA